MTAFSVRLDDIHLLSTASRRGYWDEVLLTMSVERVKQSDQRVLVDMRSANLGFMGYGHKRALASMTPLNGANWELEVPELGDDDIDIVLAVTMHNIRGMADQTKERLLAKIAAWTAGSAAEEAAEVGSAAGKWLKIGWFGIAGMLIDATIDELLKDKPVCLGLIMASDRSISPNNLGAWNYTDGGIFSADWISQAKGELHGIPLQAPGQDCNVPSAEVKFTVLQRTPLQFGPRIKWTKSYAEFDWVDIDKITKLWIDDPFNPDSRYKIVINKSTIPHKDSLDVKVFEKYVDKENYTTVIHNKMYTDVMIGKMSLLIPGKDMHGTPNPVAVAKSSNAYRAAVLADFELAEVSSAGSGSGAVEERAGSSKTTNMVTTAPLDDLPPMTIEAVVNPAKVMEDHIVQTKASLQDAVSVSSHVLANLRETAVIALPNGILLSFWRAFVKADGVVSAEGVELRYWRSGNITATRTDCWLVPAGRLG